MNTINKQQRKQNVHTLSRKFNLSYLSILFGNRNPRKPLFNNSSRIIIDAFIIAFSGDRAHQKWLTLLVDDVLISIFMCVSYLLTIKFYAKIQNLVLVTRTVYPPIYQKITSFANKYNCECCFISRWEKKLNLILTIHRHY